MNLHTILLIVLFIVLCLYIFQVNNEPFYDAGKVSDQATKNIANAHNNVPVVDIKLATSIKTGIKNTITEKPEVIMLIKDVMADPLIHSTLVDILTAFNNIS